MNKNRSKNKSKDDLRKLQEKNAQIQRRLDDMTQQNQILHKQLDEKNCQFESECTQKNQANKAMQLVELIIDNSLVIVFRRIASEDPKLRKMVYVSKNISHFGYTADAFLNDEIMFRDIVYPKDSDRTLREIQSYVSKGIENYTQMYRIVTKDGDVRWIEDRTSVVEDEETGNRYHQGIVIDIHQKKEAEDKVHKSEEKYRRIVETAGEGFLLMDEYMKIVDLNAAYSRMVGISRNKIIGKSLFDMVTEEYHALFTTDGESLLRQKNPEFECNILSFGGRKIPVLIHANTLNDDSGGIIGKMAFITDMTEHKKALALAGEVQRSLLPHLNPQIDGLDISGKNVACNEIGGDYFDFFWDPDTLQSPFTAVVGDITGHGVDSALLMATARAFLRMRASQVGTIKDIVTEMNHHLTEDVYDTGNFMTLFYLTINADRRHIEWIRAGHEPAWLYDPDNESFEELKGPGLALGIDKNFTYQVNQKTGLKKGQVIIIGTDGIWEGHNKSGEMFGKHRLKEIVRENAAFSSEKILNEIFQEYTQFIQGTQPEDDVTLVAIKTTQ
ncbi:MAG: SpoIIE family protein phosphatase [Deltaproteobacteria bacterium]|nr:SpoIIE family protein phosphatase [Deltaproteobacteria bacterium]MBW2207322.1 SpoIIE family protein phosphatase [Deltaproteobacteria bacterium]